LRVMYSTLVSS